MLKSPIRRYRLPRFALVAASLSLLFGITSADTASAQTSAPPEWERIGAQPNRDYLQLLPFEHLDTQSGNVILTLPQLTLPGNAGRSLQIQLTYNANVQTVGAAPWVFGIAGMAMRVDEQATPNPGPNVPNTVAGTWGVTPALQMADGGKRRTMFLNDPGVDTRWFVTTDFWKYDRYLNKLYLPDGTICTYAPDPDGRLIEIEDSFGHAVTTLDWTSTAGELHVIQHVGNAQRNISFEMNALGLPTKMTYAHPLGDRIWTYSYPDAAHPGELASITPPVGPGWSFEYETPAVPWRRLKHAVMPNGGGVFYKYEVQEVLLNQFEMFLKGRTLDGREISQPMAPPGQDWPWQLAYDYSASNGYSAHTVVSTPSGRISYNYAPVQTTNPSFGDADHVIDGNIALTNVVVEQRQGETFIPLDSESRTYQYVPVIQQQTGGEIFGGAEVRTRTIVRGTATSYVTTYSYDTSIATFGDYHHPNRIDETGELSRSTTYTYSHPYKFPEVSGRQIVGLPLSETITVNDETVTRAWSYDEGTGFKTRETEFGSTSESAIATTFVSDDFGNVQLSRNANNQETTFTYDWGTLKDTNTPLYTVHREIDADGTLKAETLAGRTTDYVYDALRRLTRMHPPSPGNDTTIDYDNSGGATKITTTRGTSVVTVNLDGFGRPTETISAFGVHRRAVYDAEGRVVYAGYPFKNTPDVGTAIEYDALGQVTRRTNPGGTHSDWTYGPGTVVLSDENQHVTTQTWKAFGNPDEARLSTLVDADSKTWHYTYHALGQLWTVESPAPEVLVRVWQYNAQNRLESEYHPESGLIHYTTYDAAGNLTEKTDQRQTAFHYTYDLNGRLRTVTAGDHQTTITYEAGSDRRASVTDGVVTTAVTYDEVGRPKTQQEVIGPYVFNTTYGYDNNDNLKSITYPTGRIVTYDVNADNQITRVYEPSRDYATAMAYHPSGSLAQYTTSNGIATTIEYDMNRYWVQSIQAGAASQPPLLRFTYDLYDNVGNVRSIGDSRPGMGQTFEYDPLDRLWISTSSGYPSSTYAYDVHGNRRTVQGSTTYAYETGTLRLSQQDTNIFEYDDNGNLRSASASNATYTYTPENWLATATVSGNTSNYTYDADGWRVRKSAPADTMLYLRGLHGELLAEWKNPGPTGHTKEYVYAGSRLLAAIDRDRSTLPTACGGNAIPDGSPHPITISTAGGSATVPFDGSACRQISIEVTTTSGNLGCPTISLIKPDGATFQSWIPSCGSLSFIDPVTLQYSGAYSVVVRAGSTNTGSATVRIYDVVDRTSQIVPNGPAVTLDSSTPGQRFKLTFDGVAGRRYGFLAEQLSGNCLFITVNVLNPDGTTLGNGSSCGTAPFFDPPVPTAAGLFTILIDPSGSNTGTVRVTLYESVDLTDSITANGAAVTKTLTTPGQQLRLTFDGLANHRYAFLTEQLSGNCLFLTVTVLNPNGTTLGSGSSCASAPFFEPAIPTASGTFTIVIDPPGASIGTVRVSLYDVVDLADSITPNGAAVTKTFTTPGQKLRLTFDGLANHRYGLLAEQLSGSCLFISVTVLNPNGTTLGPPGSTCLTAPFFDPPLPSATGTFTIVIDPSGANIGTVRLTLYDSIDITDSITPNGNAVTKTFATPGQQLRLTFDGVANHRYAFLAEQVSGGSCLLINVTVLNPTGTTLGSGGSCGTAPFFEPPVPTATGAFTIVIDPPGATIGTARVTLYDEMDFTGSLTINGPSVPVSLTTPGQMARLTFDITSTQLVTVRVTDGTMGFTTVRLLKPNGTEQTANSSNLSSFNLSTQTLTTPGTYTVVVDPSSTNTGNITVAVTSP